MTIQQKFNEYIASGDITISDEQRDWILPFIERCVGEEREVIIDLIGNWRAKTDEGSQELDQLFLALTQEDKIK